MHLLRDLHTGPTAKVRMPNGFSSFHTSSGVRQGCILSPPLLCCAVNRLMRQCCGKLGIQVGSSLFTDIDYADDAVLFAADPAEWQEVLLSYETAANTMGLHCKWQKTKVQNVGAVPAPPPFQMETQLVESISDQVHLPWFRCRVQQFIQP